MRSIGRNIFYGICVIVPLTIATLVIIKLTKFLNKIAKPLNLESYLGASLVIILAILTLLLICFLIGFFIQKVFAFDSFENKVLIKIPGYEIISTIVKGFASSSNHSAFPAVMIELHSSGVSSFGFIMEKHDNGLFTVFVPSSPVLTVGNTYVAKASQLIFLDAKSQEVADCISKWGTGSAKLLAELQINDN